MSVQANSFAKEFEVRFGEVDSQGVVFNAHYLGYLDHTSDTWLRSCGYLGPSSGWDYMVKKAELEWFSSVGVGDVLTISATVALMGRSSFQLAFEGGVRGLDGSWRRIISGSVTYVGIDPTTRRPKVVPKTLRMALVGSELCHESGDSPKGTTGVG